MEGEGLPFPNQAGVLVPLDRPRRVERWREGICNGWNAERIKRGVIREQMEGDR